MNEIGSTNSRNEFKLMVLTLWAAMNFELVAQTP